MSKELSTTDFILADWKQVDEELIREAVMKEGKPIIAQTLDITLQSLYDWFKVAKTKDYIEFTSANGVAVTMYKYTSTVPYFSEGDIEYMKNYISKTMMQGMFGTPYRRRANDKMVGCVDDIGQFKKAIKRLDE